MTSPSVAVAIVKELGAIPEVAAASVERSHRTTSLHLHVVVSTLSIHRRLIEAEERLAKVLGCRVYLHASVRLPVGELPGDIVLRRPLSTQETT